MECKLIVSGSLSAPMSVFDCCIMPCLVTQATSFNSFYIFILIFFFHEHYSFGCFKTKEPTKKITTKTWAWLQKHWNVLGQKNPKHLREAQLFKKRRRLHHPTPEDQIILTIKVGFCGGWGEISDNQCEADGINTCSEGSYTAPTSQCLCYPSIIWCLTCNPWLHFRCSASHRGFHHSSDRISGKTVSKVKRGGGIKEE